MKEFFLQCLKDLEPLTGIRQLYYLESDQEDGKRKLEVLIKGMVMTCKEFDYIPEASQKAIIASQMTKDQDYDALNSRVVWKWLNAFKSPYLNPAQLQDKEVVFEPLAPETEEMVQKHLANLAGLGDPVFKQEVILDDMKKIQKEDKERVERKSLSNHYRSDPEKIVLQELRKQYGLECTNIYTGRVKDGMPSFDEWLAME